MLKTPIRSNNPELYLISHNRFVDYLVLMFVKIKKAQIYTYPKRSENKEIFIYGFKHVKTDKIDNYILIGCESDEFFENNKLFNFWSNKYINNEIEKRNFQISGWPFMTLVKRNKFFKIQGIVCN